MTKTKKLFELTCKKCGKVFYHPNKHKQYCCDDCKISDKKLLICPICGKEFLQNAPAQKYCSEECHLKAKAILARQRIIEQSKIEFAGEEGIDYVECKICGQRMKFFQSSHLALHNISKKDYEAKYGKIVSYPLKYKEEHFVGENNPSHSLKVDEQTRKERSPFSKEYYKKRGLSEDDRTRFNKNIAKNRLYNTTLKYYTNKGYSEEEAKIKLHYRQKTCKGGSYSTVCNNFINEVLSGIKVNNRFKFLYGKKEKRFLHIDENGIKSYFRYDLTNTETKRIIEFNGDFWHGNPKKYEENDYNPIMNMTYRSIWERDQEKIKTAESQGYVVLTVWENDYLNNHDETIQKCKKFILS